MSPCCIVILCVALYIAAVLALMWAGNREE